MDGAVDAGETSLKARMVLSMLASKQAMVLAMLAASPAPPMMRRRGW
jgi:hypothetical protein